MQQRNNPIHYKNMLWPLGEFKPTVILCVIFELKEHVKQSSNYSAFLMRWLLTPQCYRMLSKNDKQRCKSEQGFLRSGAVNQEVNDSLHRTGQAGEGDREAAAAAAAALTHGPHSQPPPTSLCSSEKKPLLFPSAGREGGLWGEPPLSSTTPPAIKKKRRERERERRTGLPTPAWRPHYSLPASAHKHRLISSTITTVVIVFSCYLIGSVYIVALKTSQTMTLLLMHVLCW